MGHSNHIYTLETHENNQDIDLVRAHHPDSAHCRHLPPGERHARFQAITAAYDHLRGRSNPFRLHATQRPTYASDDMRGQRHTRNNHSAPSSSSEANASLELIPIILAVFVGHIDIESLTMS